MQGQLRAQPITATVDSECACCRRPLRIETDGLARHRVEGDARPLVFFPAVDFRGWKAPSIIDGF